MVRYLDIKESHTPLEVEYIVFNIKNDVWKSITLKTILALNGKARKTTSFGKLPHLENYLIWKSASFGKPPI